MATREPVAHSYSRCSTPQQADEDRSSAYRQGESAEEWSARTGVPLSGLRYEDLGRSGQGAHLSGALGRFLRALRSKSDKVQAGDYLLIEDIDRLTRQQRLDAFDLCREILSRGVTIVTMDDVVMGGEPMVYTQDALQNQAGVMTRLSSRIDAARLYVERLSGRVSRAAAKRRRDTIEQGRPIRQKCPAWIDWDQDKGRYVLNDNARTVREILRRGRTQGNTAIAKRLNSANAKAREQGKSEPWPLFGRGVDPPKKVRKFGNAEAAKRAKKREGMIARGWTADLVSRFFRTEAVTGYTTVGKMVDGEVEPIQRVLMYPPVISEDDYATLCQLRSGRKLAEVPAAGPDLCRNLYRRLATCAHCGGAIVVQPHAKRDYAYYQCRTRRRGGGCSDGPVWHQTTLDDVVLDGLAWAANLADHLIDQDDAVEDDGLMDLQTRRSKLRDQVETLAKRMGLDEMPEAAVVALGKQYAAAQVELADVEAQVAKAEREVSCRQQALRDRERALRGAIDLRDLQGTPDGRRRLREAIIEVVDSIVLDYDWIEITLMTGETISGAIVRDPGDDIYYGSRGRRPIQGKPAMIWMGGRYSSLPAADIAKTVEDVRTGKVRVAVF